MKKLIMAISLGLVVLGGCGSQTCAKCGESFSGTAYQNVILEGGGVLCADCAGYEYGGDMEMFVQ